MSSYFPQSPDSLASLPPSILNNLPALEAPEGLQSNFASSENNSHVFKSVATFLLSLMTIFFANRIYTKVAITRRMSWDDLTCTIGFLGSFATFTACLWGATKGPYGKHQWDVKLVDLMSKDFIIPTYLTVILVPLTLLFIKLSFFLFYYQVFQPLRWIRVSVYIGATLTCAFYGAATITQLIFSTPKPGETWIEQTFSKRNLKASILSVPLAAVGLGFDVVLLIMPIGAVLRMQLPTKRKIGVLSIFMFGLLACVGSILSIYYRVIARRSRDTTWIILNVELVTLLEMNVGIFCLCLPALSKMLRHHLPSLGALCSRSRTSVAKLRSSRPEETPGDSKSMQHGSRASATASEQNQGPYIHLGNQPSQPRSLDPYATYELGQLKSVQTFIRRGGDKETSDDKIHLTHEIEQQQATVREKALGRGTSSESNLGHGSDSMAMHESLKLVDSRP